MRLRRRNEDREQDRQQAERACHASARAPRVIAYCRERGIDPTWVAWAVAFDATLASISTLILGVLGSRVPVRYLGRTSVAFIYRAIHQLMEQPCFLKIVEETKRFSPSGGVR